MKNSQVKDLAYMAFYAALYVVLKYIGDMIPFLQMRPIPSVFFQ